ncbi:MAG: hypothetical protein FJ399_10990 [Verrucomicrobia bacterium]|nr:hypothetical protein [Verrucomicrobiota bacterium]
MLAPVRVFGERDADVFMPVPKFGFRLSGLQVRFPSYETAAIVETAARASQAPAHVAPTANVLLAAAPSHGRQCRLPGLGAER